MTSILPLAMQESPMSGRAVGYTCACEGDSLIGYNARRLGARDHPPAPGRSAFMEVMP